VSVLDLPSVAPRRDAVRWSICFAVVLAVHGAAALAVLYTPSPDSEFGVDAPVVTIDLPESLLQSATPPTDLAPGPMQEESEATPPPKEETKPPETEAEVAMPEPPKPEPPREEKQATAPPAATPAPAVVRRWESLLRAHLERFERYPAQARSRGEQGVVKVAFTIDHQGRLVSSRIVQSSGSALLDEESLAMLVRAQPMPKPPGDAPDEALSFEVPVGFKIR
jgi:protein TonB